MSEQRTDMRKWPKSRDERVCPHGVGHPEPDRPHHGGGVHGCDGCCTPTNQRVTPERELREALTRTDGSVSIEAFDAMQAERDEAVAREAACVERHRQSGLICHVELSAAARELLSSREWCERHHIPALKGVSGALMDSGLAVPDEPNEFPEKARKLTAERDSYREELEKYRDSNQEQMSWRISALQRENAALREVAEAAKHVANDPEWRRLVRTGDMSNLQRTLAQLRADAPEEASKIPPPDPNIIDYLPGCEPRGWKP